MNQFAMISESDESTTVSSTAARNSFTSKGDLFLHGKTSELLRYLLNVRNDTDNKSSCDSSISVSQPAAVGYFFPVLPISYKSLEPPQSSLSGGVTKECGNNGIMDKSCGEGEGQTQGLQRFVSDENDELSEEDLVSSDIFSNETIDSLWEEAQKSLHIQSPGSSSQQGSDGVGEFIEMLPPTYLQSVQSSSDNDANPTDTQSDLGCKLRSKDDDPNLHFDADKVSDNNVDSEMVLVPSGKQYIYIHFVSLENI